MTDKKASHFSPLDSWSKDFKMRSLTIFQLVLYCTMFIATSCEKSTDQKGDEPDIIEGMKTLTDDEGEKYCVVTHSAKYEDILLDYVNLNQKISDRENIISEKNVEPHYDPDNKLTDRDWLRHSAL